MDKIWLKLYLFGVLVEIDFFVYLFVLDLFDESFWQYCDCIVFVCMGKGIMYGELDKLLCQFGVWL